MEHISYLFDNFTVGRNFAAAFYKSPTFAVNGPVRLSLQESICTSSRANQRSRQIS
jgi:hypothetical protein